MSTSTNTKRSFKVLCDYSSSSDDENENHEKEHDNEASNKIYTNTYSTEENLQGPVKRLCSENKVSGTLLNVPSSIRTMYVETENRLNAPPDSSLDVNQHDQRVRSFPHTRGNWATTVFIKVSRWNNKMLPVAQYFELYYNKKKLAHPNRSGGA